MSSIPALNELGAQSLSSGDPALEELYKTSFYLTHVLQVYTSAMVCPVTIFLRRPDLTLNVDGRGRLGLDNVPSDGIRAHLEEGLEPC